MTNKDKYNKIEAFKNKYTWWCIRCPKDKKHLPMLIDDVGHDVILKCGTCGHKVCVPE